MRPQPFGLSLSKPGCDRCCCIPPFDKLRTNGSGGSVRVKIQALLRSNGLEGGGRALPPFGLSLSKPERSRCCCIPPFDRLGASGLGSGVRAGTRQLLNRRPVSANQRLLLGPRPSLDPLLECDRAFARLELALPEQLDRLARRGVADRTVGVLPQAKRHVVGLPHVVGRIRAAQQIDEEGFQATGRERASTSSARTVEGMRRMDERQPAIRRPPPP